jgi:hypothetical protein
MSDFIVHSRDGVMVLGKVLKSGIYTVQMRRTKKIKYFQQYGQQINQKFKTQSH